MKNSQVYTLPSNAPSGYLTFTCVSRPVGKERPRFGRNGAVYTPKRTVEYENAIRSSAMLSIRANPEWYEFLRKGPVDAWFVMRLKIEARNRTHPDDDNIQKSVKDAMQGIVWKNDKTVIGMTDDYTIGTVDDRIYVFIRIAKVRYFYDEKTGKVESYTILQEA